MTLVRNIAKPYQWVKISLIGVFPAVFAGMEAQLNWQKDAFDYSHNYP